MAKKLRVEIDDFQNYGFIAVVSPLPDYRFMFLLNQIFGFSFAKLPDLPVFQEKAEKHHPFPLYYFDDEPDRQELFCIGCRSQGFSILPELRQHDYLIIRAGESTLFDTSAFAARLRKADDIVMASIRSHETLKNIAGVMMDLEMHLLNLQAEEKTRRILKNF